MTAVTVTSPIGTTVHYWFSPKAKEDTTGLGIVVPEIIYGWLTENADGTPRTLSLALDDDFQWNVSLEFENAAPIIFDGFIPAAGDLLSQLSAQGWVPGESSIQPYVITNIDGGNATL